MFLVTEQMRLRLRKEVKRIMAGERKGVRGLHIPAYLGGDGVKLGHNPRGTETLLNPVDPETYKRGDLGPGRLIADTNTAGDTDALQQGVRPKKSG